MATDHRKLDEIRDARSELENHYIDELVAGRLDRRQFMRKGAVIGMSTGLMGAILAACGGANKVGTSASQTSAAAGGGTSSSAAPATKGGTLKLAQQAPATAINPLIVDDAGGLNMLAQTGEFLTFDNNLLLHLEPMLATKWTPSKGGSVWTFALRPNVKFHDGSPMTADDVVYTFQELSNPKNASNALSTFANVLKPDGVVKVDSSTVAFHLEAPNGNFPYLVSSDNYNAIIVPKGTDFTKWQSTFVGTGAFKLKSYTQNVGAEFVADVKDHKLIKTRMLNGTHIAMSTLAILAGYQKTDEAMRNEAIYDFVEALMRDEVQPRAALIVGAHNIPRCMFCIRGFQHLIPSSRIRIPFAPRR